MRKDLETVQIQELVRVECPKGISLENIARMNREYISASEY